MKRSRGYYREQREKHIERKEKIINSYREDNLPHAIDASYEGDYSDIDIYDYGCRNSYGDCYPYWSVKHKGSLSKGKIHCSCPLCAFHDTPMADKKRYENMLYGLNEAEQSAYLSKTEQTKLKKKINGRWYPKKGMSGTRFPEDNKINFEDYAQGVSEYKERTA